MVLGSFTKGILDREDDMSKGSDVRVSDQRM